MIYVVRVLLALAICATSFYFMGLVDANVSASPAGSNTVGNGSLMIFAALTVAGVSFFSEPAKATKSGLAFGSFLLALTFGHEPIDGLTMIGAVAGAAIVLFSAVQYIGGEKVKMALSQV